MNLFTKQETKTILTIFVLLFIAISFNIAISMRRGRDSVRKNDISAIQKLLEKYYQKYEIYPLSTKDGRIIGCFDGPVVRADLTGYPTNAVPCSWGESKFEDDKFMPRDPRWNNGTNYKFVSNDGKSYQFFIALEGKDEAEYTKSIEDMHLQCGAKICNYGRGN